MNYFYDYMPLDGTGGKHSIWSCNFQFLHTYKTCEKSDLKVLRVLKVMWVPLALLNFSATLFPYILRIYLDRFRFATMIRQNIPSVANRIRTQTCIESQRQSDKFKVGTVYQTQQVGSCSESQIRVLHKTLQLVRGL